MSAASLLAACQQPTTPSRSGAPTPVPLIRTPLPRPPQTPATRPGPQGTPIAGPPKPGGAIVWAAEADPLSLDPYTVTSAAARHAWGDLTYQSLVMFDDRLKLVPCLAEAWSVSEDRLTWTFKLRQGVTFHDGSPFTADDVRFWFERLMAPSTASPFRAAFSQVASVQQTSPFEVAFALSAPYAPLLATLASLRGSAIAPRRWLEGAGAAARTTAVGSGPFRIAEYVPGSHLRYVKHPGYWEKTLPYLDEIRLDFMPDEAQRSNAVRSGRSDGAPIGPAESQRLKRELPYVTVPGPTTIATTFNTRRKPFDDVRVRQAIALAVDRPAAISRAIGGEGRLTGPLPPILDPWAIPTDGLPYRQDLTQARQLLADAGHAEGFAATIKTTADRPASIGTAYLLADQLRAIGITLSIERLDADRLVAALNAGTFDLASTSIGFLPDPDSYLSALYHSHGAQNVAGWTNPHYDELVDGARIVMDPGARKALYDEASALLLQEAPAIWWFTENTIVATHGTVKGYSPSPTGSLAGLKRAWLDRVAAPLR